MDNSILDVVLMFFIYAFLGWCTEVAFAACKNGHFVNRGFLNGPICPIYGFGLVGVVLMLKPMQGNLLMLYIGSFLLTSLIELITGFLLEKLFHAKWWDYSKMPLNIGGYVCLLFSLIWGAACLGIVEWVHPLIESAVTHLPDALIIILDSIFVLTLIVDLSATLASIRKLSDRLEKLTEIAAEIHRMSDEIGSGIADKTINAKERLDEISTDIEQKKADAKERIEEISADIEAKKADAKERIEDIGSEFANKTQAARSRINEVRDENERKLAELKEKFEAVSMRHYFGEHRLLEAFPNMRSNAHDEALDRLREKLKQKRK